MAHVVRVLVWPKHKSPYIVLSATSSSSSASSAKLFWCRLTLWSCARGSGLRLAAGRGCRSSARLYRSCAAGSALRWMLSWCFPVRSVSPQSTILINYQFLCAIWDVMQVCTDVRSSLVLYCLSNRFALPISTQHRWIPWVWMDKTSICGPSVCHQNNETKAKSIEPPYIWAVVRFGIFLQYAS